MEDEFQKLRDYLAAEHKDKKKAPLDLSDWEDYTADVRKGSLL
jgi:hypothetical protein